MSKRHLEPDSLSSSFSRICDSVKASNQSMRVSSEDDQLENFPDGRWRKNRVSCTSPPGTGSLKRPRAVALKRFDFSLIKDESTGIDCQVSCPGLLHSTNSTQSSGLTTSVPNVLASGALPLTMPAAPPTMILPFLFLGSQNDALSKEFIKGHGITHILNASATCPISPYVANENFLRIPVNDSHTERLLPYFEDVKKFLDDCCKANGRALVHCLAGISRSPTLVIAYIMSHLGLSQDDAYRYVKKKRSSISPNFNFLGQLMEFELILQGSSSFTSVLPLSSKSATAFHYAPRKKLTSPAALNLRTTLSSVPCPVTFAQSPTTALARLSFDKSSPSAEETVLSYKTSVLEDAGSVHADKRLRPPDNRTVTKTKESSDSTVCLTDSNLTNSTLLEGKIGASMTSSSCQSAGQENCLSKLLSTPSAILPNPVVMRLTSGKFRKIKTTDSLPNRKHTMPPTRPSSIAISGLQFDFGLLRNDLPLELKNALVSDVSLGKYSPLCAYGVWSRMGESCHKFPVGCSHDLLQQVESACRSRSFNDIPTVTSTVKPKSTLASDLPPKMIEASDNASAGAWHSALEGRASSGSLSSVSSHGSLHGSREMVQVS